MFWFVPWCESSAFTFMKVTSDCRFWQQYAYLLRTFPDLCSRYEHLFFLPRKSGPIVQSSILVVSCGLSGLLTLLSSDLFIHVFIFSLITASFTCIQTFWLHMGSCSQTAGKCQYSTWHWLLTLNLLHLSWSNWRWTSVFFLKLLHFLNGKYVVVFVCEIS